MPGFPRPSKTAACPIPLQRGAVPPYPREGLPPSPPDPRAETLFPQTPVQGGLPAQTPGVVLLDIRAWLGDLSL